MKINYDNLWRILNSKNISEESLVSESKISYATMIKIKNSEFVSHNILKKISEFLKCDIYNIMNLRKDENEIINKNISSKKYKVISLFSGAGGFDLGFKKEGFEIIWANDFFPEAIETYKKNIGNHIVYGDIRMISSDDIPNNPDVIIGGFPCQGFSISNIKRNMNDERNFLYKEMLRIIRDKKPKMFVAENVKGLLSMNNGKVMEMILEDFKKIGYHVEYKLMNSAEYGVPQQRERVIIIGNKINSSISFPKKTNYLKKNDYLNNKEIKPAISCKKAIGWLANIECQKDPIILNDKIIYQHQANKNISQTFWSRKYNINQREICDYLIYWRNKAKISTKQIDIIFGYKATAGHWFRKDNNSGSIPKPNDWQILKKILNFDDKFDKKVITMIEKQITFEQSLRITNWNKPSDTITATSPEIHINKTRRLSVRECALIQTFPEDFIFYGKTIGKMYKQIGNAVPVKLAQKIALSIKKELDRI